MVFCGSCNIYIYFFFKIEYLYLISIFILISYKPYKLILFCANHWQILSPISRWSLSCTSSSFCNSDSFWLHRMLIASSIKIRSEPMNLLWSLLRNHGLVWVLTVSSQWVEHDWSEKSVMIHRFNWTNNRLWSCWLMISIVCTWLCTETYPVLSAPNCLERFWWCPDFCKMTVLCRHTNHTTT